MKNPLLWLLSVAVIALGVAGIVYLGTATGNSSLIPKEARTAATISGVTCLSLATLLLLFGVFQFRKRD